MIVGAATRKHRCKMLNAILRWRRYAIAFAFFNWRLTIIAWKAKSSVASDML